MKAYILLAVYVALCAPLATQADDHKIFGQTTNVIQTNTDCLAEALYYEAGSEGRLGMYLVGNVIKNRVMDNSREFRDLNNFCDVVHQPSRSGKYHECAFSYYCDGKAEVVPSITAEQEAMAIAYEVAFELVEYAVLDLTDGSLYYTQTQVNRGWMKNTEVTMTYLKHTFRKPK